MAHQFRVGTNRTLGAKADRANAKVKAVVEAHDALKSAIDDMRDYHEDVSAQGQPEEGGEDDTAKGGSSVSFKQNIRHASSGTVASPTACQLADALRAHYAERDLRAAQNNGRPIKNTDREERLRAALTPPPVK
jgi:hypothetical protein